MKKAVFFIVCLVLSCSGKERISHAELQAQENPNPVERKINKNSYLNIESAILIDSVGEKWFIGKVIDGELQKKTNIQIETRMLGVPFGPINGYIDQDLKVGWNNRDRVLYLEVLSGRIKTNDSICIGDNKSKVLEILGVPYIEEENQYRYQNTEFEVIGVIFQFEADKITKILVFSYV